MMNLNSKLFLSVLFPLFLFGEFFPVAAFAARLIVHGAITQHSNSLVLQQTFDKGKISGSTVIDSSGQRNNGTLVNSPTLASGKLGQAISFDGIDDYVDIADSSSLNLERTDKFSFSYWIKTVAGGFDIILEKLDPAPNFKGYETVLDSGQSRFVLVNVNDNNKLDILANPAINDGRWHNVAFTYSGNSDASGVISYIDGSQVAQTTESNTLSATIQNGQNMNFARRRSSNSLFFPGFLDDIRIYRRQLSSSEVATLYKEGAPFHTNISSRNPVSDGLVLLQTFNGPDLNFLTNTAFDESGQGNNGTLLNMSTSSSRVVGKVGQALLFDGSGSINFGNVLNVGSTDELTMAAWVKTRDSGTGRIIDKWYAGPVCADDSPESYLIGTYSGSPGKVLVAVNSASNGADNTHTSSASINDGKWHYVAATAKDGVNGIKIYIDGGLDSQFDKDGSGILDTTTPLQIGTELPTGGCAPDQHFRGIIDEARIYNRSLSATEITRLYKSGI